MARKSSGPGTASHAPATRKRVRRGVAPVPVVGIGASAGGLAPISELLAALPERSGLAYVIVSHLDRTHESMLDAVLSKKTRMPVVPVRDGQPVEADHVYVVPADKFVSIAGGVLHATARTTAGARPTVIDHFFASLAQDQRAHAHGVILSGSGSDGTPGLRRIRMEGGTTYVQDPRTAQFDGMPASAIQAGCADFVLPPAKIAEQLLQPAALVQPPAALEAVPEHAAGSDAACAAILAELFKLSGVDFCEYKPSTLRRRIGRRMAAAGFTQLAAYARHLRQHPEEVQALYEDVLIHVSNFFRDAEAFRALQRKVIAAIVDQPGNDPIRVWVPGCARGEEVYSIGILLLETLGKRAGARRIQLFGTDVSAADVDFARAGRYPPQIAAQVSAQRLKRHFVKQPGGYQVGKELRDLCVFACQEVGSDPPFSKLELISCRNLLIYFGRALQNRVIETFHYALKPGGYLFLGRSESPAGHAGLFRLLDKKHRIYVRNPGTTAALLLPAPPAPPAGTPRRSTAIPQNGPGAAAELRRELERVLIERYAPPGFFIDDDLQIRSFLGDIGAYLQPSPGQADFHLARMVPPGVALDIRTAIRAARKTRRPVHRETVLVAADGASRELGLTVIPLQRKAAAPSGCLVLFEASAAAAPPRGARPPTPRERSELRRLTRLLASTREQLQTVIEEQDHAAQELRTAHEELLSSNEELQSSNEELETANEELTTVNEELQRRNEELDQLAGELGNLIAGVDIPIVDLDRERRVRRFSPAAGAAFNLIDSDVGRPFRQIKPPLKLPALDELIGEVLAHDRAVEREVQDAGGRWHSLRMRPYRTGGHAVDGVLIALVDIDAAKRGAAAVVETIDQPLLVLDAQARVLNCNPAYCRSFGVSSRDTEGRSLFELGGGQWNLPALRELVERVLPQKQRFEHLRIEQAFPRIGRRAFLISGQQLVDAGVGTHTILLVLQDVTRREADVAQQLRTAADLEARRIARDLHDLVSGQLAAAGIELGRLAQLPADAPATGQALRALQARVQAIAQTTQELARSMHPQTLNDLGLIRALHGECRAFEQRHALPVRFRSTGSADSVPPATASCLYRVAQEALSNIARHAGARQVRVTLDVGARRVRLRVRDDGVGFDPGAAARGETLGLHGMAERCAAVGGTLELESKPGAGTSIDATVPLAAKAGAGRTRRPAAKPS